CTAFQAATRRDPRASPARNPASCRDPHGSPARNAATCRDTRGSPAKEHGNCRQSERVTRPLAVNGSPRGAVLPRSARAMAAIASGSPALPPPLAVKWAGHPPRKRDILPRLALRMATSTTRIESSLLMGPPAPRGAYEWPRAQPVLNPDGVAPAGFS